MAALEEIRARARALGIDPAPFGDSLEALLAAIEAAERPKMTRTAAALSAPQEVAFDAGGQIQGWPPAREGIGG